MRLLFVLLLLLPVGGQAVDLTFSNLCSGWTLKQTATGLQVRCPNVAAPRLTLAGCLGAKAVRDSTGRVVITCGTFQVALR